jgi:hypothetical protein
MEASGGEVFGWRECAYVRPEEQLRVPVRGLRELTASVQSPRRCQVVRRGTGAAVHTGSMMASPMALKSAEEEKGSLHMGRGGPFIVGRRSWQRRRELRPGQWRW